MVVYKSRPPPSHGLTYNLDLELEKLQRNSRNLKKEEEEKDGSLVVPDDSDHCRGGGRRILGQVSDNVFVLITISINHILPTISLSAGRLELIDPNLLQQNRFSSLQALLAQKDKIIHILSEEVSLLGQLLVHERVLGQLRFNQTNL